MQLGGSLSGVVVLDDRADLSIGLGCGRGFLAYGKQVLLDVVKRLQLRINRGQLLVNHVKDMSAGTLAAVSQGEDLANLLEREANRFGLDNEAQTFPVSSAVKPVPRRRALRSGKQANLLIVADGFGIQTELDGKLANAQLSGVCLVHGDDCNVNRGLGCTSGFRLTTSSVALRIASSWSEACRTVFVNLYDDDCKSVSPSRARTSQ